jgi:ketosteroid isomerase-like protein
VEHAQPTPSAGALVERLRDAVNAHDLDGLVASFSDAYRNETPAHPARGFTGRDQVRRNWEQIFAAVPDLVADVSWIADEQTAWSEWEMRGVRRDGVAHLMRGVVIFGVEDGEATWARFYLEPVDAATSDVNAAVRASLTRTPVVAGVAGNESDAR